MIHLQARTWKRENLQITATYMARDIHCWVAEQHKDQRSYQLMCGCTPLNEMETVMQQVAHGGIVWLQEVIGLHVVAAAGCILQGDPNPIQSDLPLGGRFCQHHVFPTCTAAELIQKVAGAPPGYFHLGYEGRAINGSSPDSIENHGIQANQTVYVVPVSAWGERPALGDFVLPWVVERGKGGDAGRRCAGGGR